MSNWPSLKHVARFAYGDALAQEVRTDGDVPVFGSNGVAGSHNSSNTLGPAIIVGRKGSFGKVTWTDVPGFCIDTAYFVDGSQTTANLRWLYWALQTLGLDEHSEDTGVPGLSREKAYQAKLRFPSAAAQERIANFLDDKTARIDALIAEKERLAESLRELVASRLEEEFTGVNSGAKTRQTGSAFFPEVPEQWNSSALKHLVSIPVTDGPHETPDFVPEGVPFVSAEAIKGGRVDFDRKRGYIAPSLHDLYCKKVRPRRGDVFVVKSGNTTGAVAIVETDEEFSVWSPLAVIRADQRKVLPAFLYLALQTPYFQRSVQLFWSQGTQPNIGMAVLENLQIAVPPIKDQADIVARVGALRERVQHLGNHVADHISRLREYRSSLISAAVTGQLDIGTFKVTT